MILVNLYGAPGSGKSTGAAYIFSKLKMAGVDAELVTEFAKDKVWEESKAPFDNQAYMFGKQYFRISRCADKVDVIVTDSPLPLSIFYNSTEVLGKEFNEMVMKVANSYERMDYLIYRVKPYNPNGRFQTEEESNKLADELVDFLDFYEIDFKPTSGSIEGYDKIVEEILKALK
jgi:adenylate kinase family enzyme